ncbi:DNA replication complex GINS protein psf2 [Gamsiella multidivaricata]|uniref:DNA replication complex GINS protein psf2 n=1 Tax=Gamsiella multidivaricata TaxID=101098 RepID=UPI0022210E48|nr:DNA replication complex GINS protein psf2 [Gamsiella multidivaricata]KAG0359540.1 DNA replication protein psf2 [Gamsiella multidivaricata]KAI7827127.1 DNA replication complex GINS protein psf2 [Gamsiella multidivaricata]
MALPRHLKNGLSPLEIEFLAENELIEISASIDTKQDLELLGSTIASLKPLQVNKVPLWMAITLKKKQKCSIVVPNWMTVESLQRSLKEEQEQDRFSALPYHYMETAQLLLENACDDIPAADTVRTLLKDLREARQSKARQGVAALDMTYIQMDNIGLMEINEIRPFFTKAFYEIQKLKPASNAGDLYGAPGGYHGFDGAASVGSSVPESSRFNATQGSRN